MVVVLFSIFILGVPAFGDTGLYDDFSGPYIDGQKWIDRELVREVVDGKLVSKVGNDTSTEEARNNLAFQNPSSINVIQCDITVVDTNLDTGSGSQSFARINGRFYNANTSDPTTQKGDVWAGVFIGDRGSGLEAWWDINQCLDDAGNSWADRGRGTLPVPGLTYGAPYTTKLEYDDVTNQFTFTVGGVSSGAVAGPARQGAEFLEFKGLGTGAYSSGGSGIGYASATFDDVYINDSSTLYEDFTGRLDSTKWQYLEIVREISNGKLRLNVQADGERADATLSPIDQTTDYLQTKVLVESSSGVSPGATAIARIGGYYYNDTHGPDSYNGYEGDVWVDNRITLDESHNLKARCFVSRVDTPVESGPATTLFYQEFTTPIAFDTEYTLSIKDTGSALIFRCNSETYQYTINTARYDPSIGQYRQLKSRVYADSDEYGYIKANFDDVYTGCPDQPTYDANGTWQYWLYNTWQNCPDEAPQPEMGTCTITQTDNTFTLNVDGEIDTGTICGATYTSIETYSEMDPPGTVTETITITLSSSTTGSGTFTGRYVADDGSFSCSLGGFISLTKEPGSISGQVIVPDGPIDGLWVHAFAGPCWDNWLGGTQTDEDGNYTIGNLPAGGVYVWTDAEGDHLNYVDEWYDANNGTTDCEKAAPVPVASGQNTPGVNFDLERGPKRLSYLDVCVYNGGPEVAFDVYPGFNNELVSATVDLANETQYQFDLVNDRFDLWDSECRYLDNWTHAFGAVQPADYGDYSLTLVFSDGAQETETFTLQEVSVQEVSSISVTVNDDGSAHVSWNRQTTDNYYYQVRVRDENNKEIYKSNSLPNASELYIPASDLRCLELGKTYRWLVRVYDLTFQRAETRQTITEYSPYNLTNRTSSLHAWAWNGELYLGFDVQPGSRNNIDHVTVIGPNAFSYTFDLAADWGDWSTETRLGLKGWAKMFDLGPNSYGTYNFEIAFKDGHTENPAYTLNNVPVSPVESSTMEALIYADGAITFSWDLPPGVTGQKYQVRIRSEDGSKEYYCSPTQEDMTTVTANSWDLRAMERGQTYKWFVRATDDYWGTMNTMEGSGSLTFLYDPFPMYNPAAFGPDSATLTNTYFPMQLGARLNYTGTGALVGYGHYLEAVDVETVDEVSCLKILIRGDGNDPDPDEDPEWTYAWVAQDIDGNLWLFGYEEHEDGYVETYFFDKTDAPLLMPATPKAGQVFFQRGDDYQQVQATGVTVPQLTTGLGPFTDCLKVLDIYGPNARNIAYMAPGIGTVKEEWDIQWDPKGWELSGGSISGKVSYAGTAGGTYYIGLFPSSAGEDWINQDPIKADSSTDGSYMLSNVQPGSYFIASYRDTDGDQERGKHEPWGFYTNTPDPADQNGLPLEVLFDAGETETINFTIYDWPYFTEIDVDRATFPPTGWPLGLSDEMLWAGIEVGYRPGVVGNVTVMVSGPGITDPDEVELKDDGILPDDVAGDGKYTGWVDTGGTVAGDPESYTFKLTANSLIVDEDMSVQGSALPLPTIVRPGAFVTDPQPITFEWNLVPDAQHYDLFILDSANPTTMSNILFIKEEILDKQYALTTQDLALTEGGTYYWFVSAYDSIDDNTSYSEYRSFTVDTTPPTSSASPDPGYYNATFDVTLTASQVGDITYTTDGSDPKTSGTATTEASPVTIQITTEGPHTIKFFATDNAGNEEPAFNTLEVTLDTTHPVTTADLPEGTYGTAQQVQLSVVEVNPDKTYYALLTTDPGPSPAQPTTVYTTAINLPESGEVVEYWLVYYSKDLAGNEEGVKVAHYTIDIRVPVTTFSFDRPVNEYNNAYYAKTDLDLTLSSPDNTIYYEWGEDAADDPTTSSPHFAGTGTIDLDAHLQEEIHYVVKFFAEGPGGLSEQIRTLHVYTDILQPAKPAFVPQPTSPTNVALQTIGGTKEANTAIYLQDVADPIVALNSDTTWTYGYALTEGTNQIVVFALDAAGNNSGNVQAIIVLDTVKPYTSGHDPERNITEPQPLNKPVIVHVEDAAVGVDVDSIKLTVNGIEYTKDDAVISIDDSNINDMVVTFTPPDLYPAETNVPVAVDAKDVAGNVMVQDAYTFLTSANVSVAPTAIGLIPDDTYTFTATGGSLPYGWTSDKPATSTITKKTDTTAEFTASAVDEYTVTVTDAATDQAVATVDVINPIIITATPFNDAMESGATNIFSATGGKDDGEVDWEASAGTIEPDGTFTAPTVLTGKETVTITAYDKTYNSAHITPVKAEYTLTVFAPMSIAEQPPGYEEGNASTYPLLVLGELTILTAADDTRSYEWAVTDWNDVVVDTQDTGEATYIVDPDALFLASGAGIYTVTLTDQDNTDFSAATLMVRVPMKFVAEKFALEDVKDAGTYYDTQGTDTFTIEGGPGFGTGIYPDVYIYNALDLSGVEVVEEDCGYFEVDLPTDADNVFNFTQGIDELISFRVKVTLDSTSANEDVQRLIEAELDELWSGTFTVVPIVEYSGRVVDADTDLPVQGATVTATHDATIFATTSDQPAHEGEFTIAGLPKTGATYEFVISKEGYIDKMVTGDEILADDIMLEPFVGGGTIEGIITLSDGGSRENIAIQVKADGDYVKDGTGNDITVYADPSDGFYTFPVPADYAMAPEYTVEAKKSGYIFDEDAGLGSLTGVALNEQNADLPLKPVTIISVSGTPEDSDMDETYDQVVVKITAKAGLAPEEFSGSLAEIMVKYSGGSEIVLDVADFDAATKSWSFTHDGYENFSITVYADVSEDTRDVDTGYRAEKVWNYIKSATLVGEEVKFNPNIDGFTVHFGTTTVYLPPGGLTGPIRNSVTISIVESEPEPGAPSGMVEIVMTEESGEKCDNADIQRIEITMKFNPAVVTEGTLEDGTFVILQGDNMLQVAEGTGSGVPASQIILPVDYVNGYVTFWVDHLSGFAVAAPAGPGPAPTGAGGGGGCFIDTAASEFRK
jgi:hypothetical protein